MNRKNPLTLLFSWLALTLAPLAAIAAEGTSSSGSGQAVVTGTVTNSATGRALEGARVVLQGAGRETFTDKGGAFRFAEVAPGPVVLSVSYTGLISQDVTLQAAAGTSTLREVGLTADIYTLSKFVVSGEREGNALAITLQRQSAGVKNVVSTDAFGSLGANPADLVARLPGVFGENDGSGIRYIQIRGMANQLNSITMDGNRMADAASAGSTREFQFTQVSADTVERIEVTKSPTPDMDADSIGGAVNFVSKSAFDRKGRQISGQLGVIYRVRPGAGDFPRRAYALSYSEVFGGKLGVAINYANRSHFSPYAPSSRAYEDKLADPAYTYQFGTEDYYHKQTRWGGGLKLDYKLSASTRFYTNLTKNRMVEPNFSHYATYSTAQSVATRDAAGNLTGTGAIVPGYTKTLTEWRPVTNSQVVATSRFDWKHVGATHGEIGAVHKFTGLDIDYNVYGSKSTTNYPHQEQVAITARGIGLRIEDTDQPNFPKLTQTAGPDITKPESYTTTVRDLRVAQGKDAYRGGAINLKKSFDLVTPAWVKAGLRVREQKRDLFDERYRWNYVGADGVAGVNPATGINDDNVAQFVNGNIKRWGNVAQYPLLPWLTYPNDDVWVKPYDYTGNDVASAIRERPTHFVEDVALRTMTTLYNRQNFKESIKAGYIMGNLQINKFQVLAGLRVEDTKTEGEGGKNEITPAEAALRAAYVGAVTPAETIRRNTAQYSGRQKATGDYRGVFPAVHFKYEVTNRLLMRASYSTNIGRPSIGQLIPNTTVDNINRTLTTSNPSLKPQYANNFDVSAEYYFEPVGMFSAGVFLKEIKQFIFTRGGNVVQGGTDNGFGGDYVGYTFSAQYNGGFAKVRGFELAYQQQFTFLPGFWKGFGVYANYARNETEGDYGGTVATTKVAGFIPETANAGISYIRSPLSLRFQFAHSGRRLITVTTSQARLVYERARDTLDVKTVYEINRNFSLYLDVNNLFSENERAREYEGGRRTLNYHTGAQILGGVNARF